jgi:hypothetical protein
MPIQKQVKTLDKLSKTPGRALRQLVHITYGVRAVQDV